MSNVLLTPGYRVCEYRLIIPLSEALQESVTQIRRDLHEKYRISPSFELKPSLAVLHFHAYEGTEARLLERIQQAATRVDAFYIELQNYAASSGTIYIDVLTRHHFHELTRELKVVKSLIAIPDHDPHFINEPQLLIAQNLKPFQFTRMWMDCEHMQFTGKFAADGMLLMRRSITHNRYEEIKRFEFSCLAYCIKQGILFG